MSDVSEVYSRLLGSIAGENTFNDAIDGIVDHFGAGGGIVFELNRRTGQIVKWQTPSLIIGDDGYDGHINSINPRMRYSLRHAPGHLVHESRFITNHAMDRHEFYDWLNEVAGFRYFIGSRLYDDGDISVFHSIEFSQKHGAPSERKIEAFKKIAPSVAQAWKLRERVAPANESSGASIWTPDHLPWAIYALSEDAKVLSMNRAGYELIEQGRVLELVDDQLKPLDRVSIDPFNRALQTAFTGRASQTLLADDNGETKLITQCMPVNTHKRAGNEPVAALVYIANPLKQGRNVGAVLGHLYDFTPAEQDLANLLATGIDLKQAGEYLGLSRNTVRNRLQSMYVKTNTHRQNEFLVKVMGII